jgi:glycosyltransferase involved in cell wall biosynthesis
MGKDSSRVGLLRLSVVVPVFNSAPALEELRERVDAALEPMPQLESWELILVNDGSEDASWETILRLSREHPEVRGIDLTRNWGQHNALLAGAHAARYDVIVTLDDDLQNPPEEIPKLVGALGPDLDVVYGAPIANSNPAYRRFGSIAVRGAVGLITRRRAPLISSGFRAFRADLIRDVPDSCGRRVILDSFLRARTDRFGSAAVAHEPRRVGRSNYNLLKLLRHALAEFTTAFGPIDRNVRRDPSYGVRAATESQLSRDGRR